MPESFLNAEKLSIWIGRINANSTILKSVCGGTSRFICPTSVSPVHWYRMASWFLTIIVCCRKKKSEADETICWYPIRLILFRAWRKDGWFFEMIEWLYSRIFIKISTKGVMLDNRFNILPEFPSPVREAGFAGGGIWIFNADLFFHVPEVYLSCEQWLSKWLEEFFFLYMVECEINLFSFKIKINFKLLLCIRVGIRLNSTN